MPATLKVYVSFLPSGYIAPDTVSRFLYGSVDAPITIEFLSILENPFICPVLIKAILDAM
jgi:hypothetical protein